MKKITMQDALEMLNIPYPHGKSSFYIECPFCKDLHKGHRKTFNVNMNKGDGGVFSCLRCNLQGHVITFWREMKGFSSNKEAAKDIQFTIRGENSFKLKKKKKKVYKEPAIANIETRTSTYNALIDLLVLNKSHEEDLRKRGLNTTYIKEKKYVSVPQTGHQEIATVLLDKGLLLDGVPGFYKKRGEWTFSKTGSGIMIPQRDILGRIQGFQMRMDNPRNGKYINLTSNNFPSGTPSKTFVHFSPNFQNSIEEIILTEGVLKADVISFLSGMSVLSVPGVNSTKFLPEALYILKNKGLKKINIAFDMDMYDNANVYRAFCKIKNLLRDADIPFCTLDWDKKYKGLDDFLNRDNNVNCPPLSHSMTEVRA